jgi:hypothetical protein
LQALRDQIRTLQAQEAAYQALVEYAQETGESQDEYLATLADLRRQRHAIEDALHRQAETEEASRIAAGRAQEMTKRKREERQATERAEREEAEQARLGREMASRILQAEIERLRTTTQTLDVVRRVADLRRSIAEVTFQEALARGARPDVAEAERVADRAQIDAEEGAAIQRMVIGDAERRVASLERRREQARGAQEHAQAVNDLETAYRRLAAVYGDYLDQQRAEDALDKARRLRERGDGLSIAQEVIAAGTGGNAVKDFLAREGRLGGAEDLPTGGMGGWSRGTTRRALDILANPETIRGDVLTGGARQDALQLARDLQPALRREVGMIVEDTLTRVITGLSSAPTV